MLKSLEAKLLQTFEVLNNLDNPYLSAEFSKIELLFSHDNRFIFLRNKQNLGVAETQKISLEMSRGSYLAFQAEDNLLHADYLIKIYDQIIKGDSEEFISFCSANILAQKIFSIKHVSEIPVFKARSCDEVCDYLLIGKSVFSRLHSSLKNCDFSFSMALAYSSRPNDIFRFQKQVNQP